MFYLSFNFDFYVSKKIHLKCLNGIICENSGQMRSQNSSFYPTLACILQIVFQSVLPGVIIHKRPAAYEEGLHVFANAKSTSRWSRSLGQTNSLV